VTSAQTNRPRRCRVQCLRAELIQQLHSSLQRFVSLLPKHLAIVPTVDIHLLGTKSIDDVVHAVHRLVHARSNLKTRLKIRIFQGQAVSQNVFLFRMTSNMPDNIVLCPIALHMPTCSKVGGSGLLASIYLVLYEHQHSKCEIEIQSEVRNSTGYSRASNSGC
jgi:hypothetical protein